MALLVVVAAVAAWLVVRAERSSVPAWRQRIAAAALSQVGYQTDPRGTYCNQYSAYWGYGAADCGGHNLDEEWCADFAAWAWNEAGVPFQYGQQAGQISSAAISFYFWGVGHGTWRPASSGYRPSPGDVAVYGLDLRGGSSAHVAVVTGYQAGDPGDQNVGVSPMRSGDAEHQAGG